MNRHSIYMTKPLFSVPYVLDLHIDNEQGISTKKKSIGYELTFDYVRSVKAG